MSAEAGFCNMPLPSGLEKEDVHWYFVEDGSQVKKKKSISWEDDIWMCYDRRHGYHLPVEWRGFVDPDYVEAMRELELFLN